MKRTLEFRKFGCNGVVIEWIEGNVSDMGRSMGKREGKERRRELILMGSFG